MKYNLKPIIQKISDKDLAEKVQAFFSEPNENKDVYYDIMLNHYGLIEKYNDLGYLFDPHTGLIAHDLPYLYGNHSYSMCKYIKENFIDFVNKDITVITEDFGIISQQLKICGCRVLSTTIFPELYLGAIFSTIMNGAGYIPINQKSVESDLIIVSSSFASQSFYDAYNMWNLMLDLKLQGKEVYFTCNALNDLKNHYLPNKIELVSDTQSCYSSEELADLRYGYKNKIYRIV